jgi:ParB-like chromosome segregation protein Spo0J
MPDPAQREYLPLASLTLGSYSRQGPMAQAQLEYLPLASLTPYARNARTHSPAQITQLVASIEEFGWTNPVLIDAAGEIIAGHGRVLAAQQIGLVTVPCLRLGHLSAAQKRAYVIADNKLALNAGWDLETLAAEIAALGEMAFDLGLLGFDEGELANLVKAADETPPESSTKEIDPDNYAMGSRCPRCGFEFDE